MDNKWYYNNQEINSIDDMKKYEPKVFGFVYHLTLCDKNSKEPLLYYIGKKNIYSVISKTATKKEFESNPKSYFQRKKMKNGTWKYYKTIINESNWKNYFSSNSFIKENKNNYDIKREILLFSTNDSDLTYREAKEIMCSEALDNNLYLNDSISIRRFGKKLIN